MGFIRDICQKTNGSDKTVNPLEAYSMYNFNDVLNDIYIIDDLREKGDEQGAKKAYDSFVRHGVKFQVGDRDLDNFLSYLIGQNQLSGNILLSEDHERKHDKNKHVDTAALTDNEKLVSAVIIQESRDSSMFARDISYETLCKFLNLSHARQTTLSNKEYSQLSEYKQVQKSDMYKSLTRRLVAKFPIPEITHIDDIYTTDDLSDLYDDYGKDEYFCDNYKIKNVYAIAPNKQSKNAHKQGSHSLILNSGTSNESLIKILSGGFKLPSQLAKEAGVQMSGQMYGDAIYFARPDQISKNTAYVDRRNPGSKFIMVAEVYYDKKINADNRGRNFKYNGNTLVHAHNVGRYDRDEYMVHPSQIRLKYVLEVDSGRFVKPKPKVQDNANAKSDTSLSLDDLDIALQI